MTPRTKPLYRRSLPRSIFEIEGAETLRGGVLFIVQNGGFYRNSLRIYGGALRPDAGRHVAAQNVAAPPDHQVQRQFPIWCNGRAAAVFTEGGAGGNAGGPSVCISPMPAGYPILWKSWISGMWAGRIRPISGWNAPVGAPPGNSLTICWNGRRSSWHARQRIWPHGEGFFRLTAFGTPEDTAEAMERFRAVYGR